MNHKQKRKNKTKSMLLALFIIILTCIAISGTFARYTTSTSGIGEAQVAAWNFEVNGLEDATLATTDLTKTVANGRLAPGTEGEFAVEVNAYGSEVAVDYEIEILDIKNKPENLSFYTNSTYTTQVVGVEKEVTNEDGTTTTQTTYTVTGHMTLDEVLNEDTAKRMVRMYWRWPFETAGENSDEQDTLDGLAGSMEFSVKVVGSQSLEDAPEVTTYKINYDLNNGTGEIRSQTKQEGIDAKITSLVPTRTGYKFLGWATKEDATQATYVAGDTFAVDADTTLYAVWQAETCTITYNYSHNGGTSAAGENTATVEVAYGSEVELKQDAIKSGYDFAGWSTSSSTNDTIDSLVMGKDVTLYAVYSKDVTVTYNYYENNSEVAKQTTIYNDQVLRMNITEEIPERQKFVFVNWEDGEGTSYNPGDEITTTEDITLYAQWEDAVATTETTGYKTLALAMADADNGQTVTMLQDSEETEIAAVASGKELTLDLGGKTVEFKQTNKLNNYGMLTIVGSGKITGSQADTIFNSNTGTLNVKMNDDGIIDSTVTDLSGKAIANQGTVNIDSGIIQNSAKAENLGTSAVFAIVNLGTINMNGGTIRGISADNGLQYGIWFEGTLNINGGMIETSGTAIARKDFGNITITGGTIKVGGTNNTVSKTAIVLDDGTNLEIKGDKTVHIYNKLGAAIQNSSTGAINITNPNVVIEGKNALINETTGIVTIGTDDGTVSTTSPSIIGATYGINMRSGTLNFYDGVITGATAINGTVADWPAGYCVNTTTTDGVQTAVLETAIASTSTRGYASLAEAMEGAADTDTVKMLQNSTETETATVASGKDITLDLGGQTVTYSGINGIENAGTLTVVGSGKITDTAGYTIKNTGTLNVNMADESTGTAGIIETTSASNKSHTIYNVSGIVNINSGVVANSAKTEDMTNQALYVIANNANVNINGGIIRCTSSNHVNQYGIYTAGTLNMNGGTIETVGTALYTGQDANVRITGGKIENGVTSNAEARAAINHNSTGVLEINGTLPVSINSKLGEGIYNQSTGILTIGTDDGTVSTISPSITGSTYGINIVAGTLNFYDGVIKGATAINGTVADTPDDYSVKTTTTDGVQTAILSKEYMIYSYGTVNKELTINDVSYHSIGIITYNEDHINLCSTQGTGTNNLCVLRTADPVNLTEYNTVVVKKTNIDTTRIDIVIGNVGVTNGQQYIYAEEIGKNSVNKKEEVIGDDLYVWDISEASVDGWIEISGYKGNNDGNIYEIYLSTRTVDQIKAQYQN